MCVVCFVDGQMILPIRVSDGPQMGARVIEQGHEVSIRALVGKRTQGIIRRTSHQEHESLETVTIC